MLALAESGHNVNRIIKLSVFSLLIACAFATTGLALEPATPFIGWGGSGAIQYHHKVTVGHEFDVTAGLVRPRGSSLTTACRA